MQKTTINIRLELSGGGNLTSWEEIEKLIADIEYTCNERGYDILNHVKSTTTKSSNDEELLSVEEMTL
jgi:hypothetical protein